MERGTALIEHKSYYELTVSGKPVAWFDALTDSCMSDNIMLSADSSVTKRSIINGCWVNKYAFMPSCHGMILTTDPDSMAYKTLAAANKNIGNVIKNTAERLESAIKSLSKKDEELRYYLSVHNVNDDGYNTMAYLDGRLKQQKEQAEKALEIIRKAQTAKNAAIRLVSKYTLLHKDTAGHTVKNSLQHDNSCKRKAIQNNTDIRQAKRPTTYRRRIFISGLRLRQMQKEASSWHHIRAAC